MALSSARFSALQDQSPVCSDVAQSALRTINAISATDAIKGDGQATAQQVEDYFRDLYPGLGDFPKAVMVPRVADVERCGTTAPVADAGAGNGGLACACSCVRELTIRR